MKSLTAQKEHRRERLSRLMDEIGQVKLAGMTGISEAQLYQMSKGKGVSKRNVSDERARLIESRSGKGLGWLDAADEAAADSSIEADDQFNTVSFSRRSFGGDRVGNAEPGPDLAPIRMVPIVSMVQAGPDGYFAVVGVIEGEFVPFYTRSTNAYALRVRGDSMRPRIRSGQIIVADPDTVYGPEDDVVVKLATGEYMVKELLIERSDEIVVTSVNNGERRTIAKADIEYIHCVVDIMRRGI